MGRGRVAKASCLTVLKLPLSFGDLSLYHSQFLYSVWNGPTLPGPEVLRGGHGTWVWLTRASTSWVRVAGTQVGTGGGQGLSLPEVTEGVNKGMVMPAVTFAITENGSNCQRGQLTKTNLQMPS